MPNNSPELANNNNGAVPLPQDTKSPYDVFGNWNWNDILKGAMNELAAGARDAQSTGLQYEFPADVAKDISGGFDPYIDADPYAPTNSAQEWGGYLAIGGSLVYGGKNPASAAGRLGSKVDDVAGAAGKSVNTHFPSDPTQLTKALGVEPKVTTTQHGTTRMEWQPNSNTKIRYESHPNDVGTYNPRHHGEHYHVEIKPDNLTWNQAKRQGQITKVKPENYQPGTGTGFIPGEKYPGVQ